MNFQVVSPPVAYELYTRLFKAVQFGDAVTSFDVVSLEDLDEPRHVHTVTVKVEHIYVLGERRTFQMVDELDNALRIQFNTEELNGPAKYEANITSL